MTTGGAREVRIEGAAKIGEDNLEDGQARGVLEHPTEAGQAPPPPTTRRGDPVGGSLSGAGSMAGKVAKGAQWSAVSNLGGQGVQFLAGLVLARLLTPTAYGTMASVYVITGFAVLFFELGLGSAVIALRDPSQRDLSTAFWINALGGVAFTLLLAAAGPLVALIFGDPKLVALTPLVGLTFLFGVGGVHNSLLQRQLRFKAIAVIRIVPIAVAFAVTIAFAALGFGVYALVIGPIVSSILSSAMSWAAVPWRPTGFISRESLPRLWAFSGGQLGFNVVNYWGRNADNYLVSAYVSQAALGFYNKAYQLMLLPVTQVSQVLGRVMFPALAAMKDDHVRVARAYLRALKLINLIAVPALVGMAATAPGLVPLLWGGQWGAAVPLLMVLSIAGVPQCMAASGGWLYQSQNRTGSMFRVGAVTSAVGIALMVAGLLLGLQSSLGGPMGVALAVLVRMWLLTPATLHYAGRLVGLPARRIVRQGAPIIAISAVMFAVVWFTPTVLSLSRTGATATVVQVVLGAAVYGSLAFAFQRSAVTEALSMIRRRRSAAA